MGSDGVTSREEYVSGFRDRVLAMRSPGQELIDEPGMVALVGQDPARLDGRALVFGDEALDLLTERRLELLARVCSVFDDARACHGLMTQSGRYQVESCTAMVRDELAAVAQPALPPGLVTRPVAVLPGTDGIPLVDAARVAVRSDPATTPATGLDAFLDYLRSVPGATYLAAVDDHGTVRATAASATWGRTTGVYFVSTDPAWRGRGVGTAMTAAALRAALACGADRACLDASALGLSIYLRLGFASAGTITQFVDPWTDTT